MPRSRVGTACRAAASPAGAAPRPAALGSPTHATQVPDWPEPPLGQVCWETGGEEGGRRPEATRDLLYSTGPAGLGEFDTSDCVTLLAGEIKALSAAGKGGGGEQKTANLRVGKLVQRNQGMP